MTLSLAQVAGKDLSKSRRNDQLVDCKDTGLYLQLYISRDHEKQIMYP